MSLETIVVVGASLAGLRACERLRADGFQGTIRLVGAEPHLPYDRPPLSKKLLTGEWGPGRIALREPQDYEKLELSLHLGVPASALNASARSVALADGSELAFDGLILATGAAPRSLPEQPALRGIHQLRSLEDAIALRERLTVGGHVVVIGAGFIGLEVAAAAESFGCCVEVLEAAGAPLLRALGPHVGAAVVQATVPQSVSIRCGVQVAALRGKQGSIDCVELADGEVIPADCVVVGIGVAPAIDWLRGSGLRLDNGIVCDETLWTGVDSIYAAGDCASWPNGAFDGERMRVEHWTNAAEQGSLAAANLLATASGVRVTAYSAVPFVWSDLFGARVQLFGRPCLSQNEQVHLFSGQDGRSLLAVYTLADRVRAVVGVNATKPLLGLRALVAQPNSAEQAMTRALALDGFQPLVPAEGQRL